VSKRFIFSAVGTECRVVLCCITDITNIRRFAVTSTVYTALLSVDFFYFLFSTSSSNFVM